LIQFGQFLMGEIGRGGGNDRPMPSAETSLDSRQLSCDPMVVREFLAYLYGQNYTKSTTARKLATLRSFYKFLVRRGMLSVNPLSTIRTPKQEKRLPKCLDLEQVQKLAGGPRRQRSALGPRQGDAGSPLFQRHPRQRTGGPEHGDIDLTKASSASAARGANSASRPSAARRSTPCKRYFELRSHDARARAKPAASS
jgi:integrase/recombinase XerC